MLLHFDSQGYVYNFDLSGKEFPRPDGGTTSWREMNQITWEATNNVNGTVTASYRPTLKGDSLTSVMKATAPMAETLSRRLSGAVSQEDPDSSARGGQLKWKARRR